MCMRPEFNSGLIVFVAAREIGNEKIDPCSFYDRVPKGCHEMHGVLY